MDPARLVLRLLPYILAPLAISVFGSGKTYWFARVLLESGGVHFDSARVSW